MKTRSINMILRQLIKHRLHYVALGIFVTFIMMTGINNSVFSQTHNIPSTGNDTWVTCSGTLYDNGGTGNYTNSCSGYTVITPSTAGNLIRVSGSIISEGGYDYLAIYDGVGTGGALLWGGSPHSSGTACVTTTVPTITSTSGSLTIKFYSDVSAVCAGVTLTVACISNEMTVPATGSNSYTSCSGHLYDNGGSAGAYLNNQDGYTVIYPSNSSQAVQLTGNYDTESCCEHIYIYNGAGLGGALLYSGGGGIGSIGTILSSGPNVPLTVKFTSDVSVTATGFDLTISCVSPCTATLSIAGPTTACSSTSISYAATPAGFAGTPTYQWYCNSAALAASGGGNAPLYSSYTGGTSQTLNVVTFAGVYSPVNWYCVATYGGCTATSNTISLSVPDAAPSAPVAGAHTLAQTQIVWNWNAVAGASGYKWSASNDFATATDMGTALSKTETGLTCNTSYTRYVWAYKACGYSTVTALSATTSTCCVTPAVVTVSGGGDFCSSTTLTATGGSGGTIYWQGTTSNGTSTATPSTSETVSSNGTYYFRACNACGVWGTQGSVTVTKDITAPTYAGFSNVAGYSYYDGTSYWVNGGDVLTFDIRHTENLDVKTQFLSYCHGCTPNACAAPNEIKSYNSDGTFNDWMADDAYLNITGTTIQAGGWSSNNITNRWSTAVSASCPDWDWYLYTFLYDWCDNGQGYTALGQYVKVDNSAPTTPGTPICTSGSGSASLSWSTSGSTDGRSGMNTSGYQWQWSYDGSSWNAWFTGGTSGSGTWSCGNTLYVRVRSVDNVGNYSAWSTYGSATTTTTVSLSPAFVQFCYGGSQTLTAVSSCSAPVYEWFKNGVTMGITTPTYTATTPGLYSVKVTCGSCSATSSPVTVIVQSNPFTLNVTLPPTSGLATGYYVWSGNTSIDWAVPTNWLVYQGAGVFTVAATIPDSTKNVVIRNWAGCASNLCNILSGNTGKCKSITIESSLTMNLVSYLEVARNWTNTLGTFNPGTGTVTFNGQLNTSSTVLTGGTGAGKRFYNVAVKSATGATGNIVNLTTNDMMINNDLILTTGREFNCNNRNVTIAGNFLHEPACGFNRGTGSVTLTGTSKLIGGTGSTYFRILNISGSYLITEPSIYLWSNPVGDYGDLNILPGGSLDASNKVIHIDGNWTNQGTFTAGTSTVIFERAYDQAVISGGSKFYNFTMNRTATPPYVTLTDPAWITNYGNFLRGVVNFSGSGSLKFTDNATSNGGADTSFVNGSVIKTGNETFLFPVGEVTTNPAWTFVWAPLAIANAAGVATDQFTCDYFFTASPHNWDPLYMCTVSQLNHTSGIEYWTINRDAGSSLPNVTLHWKNALRSGINNIADIVVAHYEPCPLPTDSEKWRAMPTVAAGTTGAGGVGTAVGSGFTNYSPVTFATKLNTNPLPVELLSFTAKCNNNAVEVTWSTATEANNDYFTVQRSADASDWESVTSIPAAGNSNSPLFYSATDVNPFSGNSYYRLKQTDYDGQSEIFSPVAVICGSVENTPQISYYPNPFTSEIMVDIRNLSTEKATLVIYDVLGKKVFDKIISRDELSEHKFTLSLGSLSAGVYMVHFTSDEYSNSSRIVKNY